MNAKKQTAGKTATESTAHNPSIDERRAARVERWRGFATERINTIPSHDREMLRTVAEAAGFKNAADFVVWQMKRERGLAAAHAGMMEKYHLSIDDYYENEPTRSKNGHERNEVFSTMFRFCTVHAHGLTNKEEIALVRRYFRKGDGSLAKAEARAIRFSL